MKLLRSNFESEELKDLNQYYCDYCKRNSILSLKTAKISKLPNTLILTINRFLFDLKIQKKRKLMDFVKIDKVINMHNLCDKIDRYEDEYQLSAIVIHRVNISD